jgi:hypothetical protein
MLGYGLVIITLQETQLDSKSTLRIFAPLDDVLKLLSIELELKDIPQQSIPQPV